MNEKIRKILSFFMALIMAVTMGIFTQRLEVQANVEADNCKSVIYNYYQYLNQKDYSSLLSLYGVEALSYLEPFISEDSNVSEHRGIYNVIQCYVKDVQEIESLEINESIYEEQYILAKSYYVKCDMQVYESDKYYMHGTNYFVFTIAKDVCERYNIINISIPSYDMICLYDDEETAKEYKKTRNMFIYGISGFSKARGTDEPQYVDYVTNPLTIDVLINGKGEEIDFEDYLHAAVAVECNSGLTKQEGYNMCALAVKMFAIHKVESAALGADYQIDPVNDQGYNPNKELSSYAEIAVDFALDNFVLDEYGAVFPTFYRSVVAKLPQYCVEHGGVMPQKEADAMISSTMTWKQVMKYYYERVSTVNYYNSKMNYGSLIFTYEHVHDWSADETCGFCGAYAK